MAERTFIPSLPACGQWRHFWRRRVDGLLKPADEAAFLPYGRLPACSALFEEGAPGPRVAGVPFDRAGVPPGCWIDSGEDGTGASGGVRAGGQRRQHNTDDSGLAASGLHGLHPALCRAAADDDGGDGFFPSR